MIIFLNEEGLDEARKNNPGSMGALRLYLPGNYIDVVPRMGRVVIFKSEIVEHEVRPTLGFDNYAVTVWFNQVVKKNVPAPIGIIDHSIFIGIPAYSGFSKL